MRGGFKQIMARGNIGGRLSLPSMENKVGFSFAVCEQNFRASHWLQKPNFLEKFLTQLCQTAPNNAWLAIRDCILPRRCVCSFRKTSFAFFHLQ